MPRGGPPSNTYVLPAVYLAIPGTTILATQHNSPLEDIADTLNDPWPTNLGGTGGTSAITSWDAINTRGDDVATSATVDLDPVTGPNVHLTGTATITSISLSNGHVRYAVADSAFSITPGASLVVNGSTSIPASISAGSVLTIVGGSAGVVYVNSGSGGSGSLFGYTTTATAAGTTVLTVASTYQQYFSGTQAQTVTLPVTSTLSLGFSFRIVNNSTGIVTVNSSGGNAVVLMQAGTVAIVTCILTSGTTAASWSVAYVPATVNANATTLTVASQDAGAAAAPIVELYRNSISPATNDVLGQILFNGEDSAGNTQEYASIQVVIADATSASEDGTLEFYLPIAGSRTKVLSITGSAIATAAEWLTGTSTTKLLGVSETWGAAAWVNLGASLTGNLTVDFATGINFYGTATGNITFNAVSNAKDQSGEIMITASGGDRTVSFNTTPFATPNNASLGTITSGTTMLFSYTRAQSGKFVISAIGTVS